ncbi:1-acyl-sn-glycerol-3-phosphate acyltransferase [Paraburkholderia sp. MMS20-SJTR3]|uniref:1-acyl-sn-glycerol-3-phosphate acyltransferase n=1 Tax=Paraburkholderia sejongensis TaxID=2886946 RepID=A0ABS8JZ65_9BURK|nr:1-acyl-sn-glycerol-3-phosphate acyltransferase [Paraburkholderia sp. MMS20-SJTR3]MCC8395118.1 1-acyl-sn-glycerol-3-phosphate acyltransferase [Paraburkholderia sp. MMS20-SJTR3]
MRARLDYLWRLCATGLAFAVFGVCGLVFSVLVFPLAWLWPQRASRQRAVSAVIHGFFRALVALLQRIGVMELDVRGAQALRAGGPAVVVANHPTYLDVMVLLALTPRACCVVKNAHWRNPCFWGIVRAAEYVSNSDATEFVDAGARQLASGYTMLIFPEGTRSPAPNRLHAFSRGFAHMALKTGAPIVPVLIDCDPPAFTRQMRWYHVPARAFRMRVNVLAPLGIDELAAAAATPAIAARSVTHAVEAHITQHLFDYGFFKTGN